MLGPLIAVALLAVAAEPTEPTEPAPSLSTVRVIVPDAIGSKRFGVSNLSLGLRRSLAGALTLGTEKAALQAAQDQLGHRGASRHKTDNLAAACRQVGADYVLRVVVTRKGWLYEARAHLIECTTGTLSMDFTSGYYKPDAEAEDRGERIGRATIKKLQVLMAERLALAAVDPPSGVVTPTAPTTKTDTPPDDPTPSDSSSVAMAAADPFESAFDSAFAVESMESLQSDEPAPAPDNSARWEHAGYIEARYYGFLNNTPLLEGKDRHLMTLGLRGSIDGRLGSSLRLRVLPFLMIDVVSRRLFRAALEEGYVGLSLGNVEVRLGWDTLSWGSASTINIIDIANPLDLTEGFLDSGKKGQPMLSVQVLFGEHSLRLSYMSPFVQPTIPRLDSPFFPVPLRLGGPGPLATEDTIEPVAVFGSDLGVWLPQAAARLSLVLGPVDLNMVYFVGYARFPLIDLRTIELIYPVTQQLSVDGQWLADPWLLKWEIGYTIFVPTDTLQARRVVLPNNRLSWVLGLERTFDGVLGNTTITPIIELVGDSDSTWFTDDRPPDDAVRLFQNQLVAAFRWSFENRVNSEITFSDIMDLTRPAEHILTVEYSERWFGAFTFSFGGRLVVAAPDSKIVALEQLMGVFTRIRANY